MTGQVNTQNVQMTFTPPKVGVVEPPKGRTSGVLSKDTIEIANAKTPQDIKNAGIKKEKKSYKHHKLHVAWSCNDCWNSCRE